MTEPCAEPIDDPPPLPKSEPRWYPWTIKLLFGAVALLATVTVSLLVVYLVAYLGPTVRSNADAVKALAVSTAREKNQDACYDLFTAAVTDGNANAFAAALGSLGAIGTLVVDLSTPAPQRDPTIVPVDVAAIKAASAHGAEALAAYNKANDARTAYSAAGRPLPCPRT